MKRYVLTVALCACVLLGWAQKREVTRAFNAIRMESPDIAAARAAINNALASDETKNDAKTWYVAGFIENEQYKQEVNKLLLNKQPDQKVMYDAMVKSFDYLMKAAELDQLPNEKGKVKPKYLKEIKSIMTFNHPQLFNAGAVFFDAKDYRKAYNTWDMYVEVPQLPYMQELGATVPQDTNLVLLKYYKALAAIQIPDTELAIRSLSDIKNNGYKENEVLQLLSTQYETLKDTTNLIAVYKEGAERFPEEAFFVQNLIALYINKLQLDEALQYLDQALQVRPNDPQLWTVKGSIYEQQEKPDMAIVCFEKALEVDPEYADAVGNVGRVYYNRAVLLNDEVAKILDNKKYEKRKAEEVDPAFKKALPYLQKAHRLQPDVRDWMYALRGIYYNLDMGKELQAIEAEINR